MKGTIGCVILAGLLKRVLLVTTAHAAILDTADMITRTGNHTVTIDGVTADPFPSFSDELGRVYALAHRYGLLISLVETIQVVPVPLSDRARQRIALHARLDD